MGFEQTFLETIDTSDVKMPQSPQLKFKNPLKKNIFVNSIVLTGGIGFLTRGKVFVTINDVAIFSPSKKLQFKNTPSISIPLNEKILPLGKSVKVFAWNDVDSQQISLSVEVKFSEEKGSSPSTSSGNVLTITPEDVRKRNSIFQSIFPQKSYSSSPLPVLIDMNGYTKMILIISGSLAPKPAIVRDDFSFTAASSAVDGDLNTSTDIKSLGVVNDRVFSVDFGTIKSRIPAVKFEKLSQFSDYDLFLEVSNDDVTYITVDSIFTVGSGIHTMQGGLQSFRYMRLRVIYNSGGVENFKIYEFYDGNNLGGSASISFDVFDETNNVWVEIISGSQIGAITTGGKFTKQLGDLINDESNNKFNVILPSTPTNFRINMNVNGNINTGVSILKVD